MARPLASDPARIRHRIARAFVFRRGWLGQYQIRVHGWLATVPQDLVREQIEELCWRGRLLRVWVTRLDDWTYLLTDLMATPAELLFLAEPSRREEVLACHQRSAN